MSPSTKFVPDRKALAAFIFLAAGLGSATAQPVSDGLQFSAGVGVISQPEYPGSGDRETRGLPVLSATYGRYFLGGVPGAGVPFGVGAYLVQDGPFRLGVGLGGQLSKPREEGDSPRLRGLGDIDRTALGSVFGSYSFDWLTLRSAVITDIGGDDQGTRVSFDVEAKYSPLPKLLLSAGPGLTWADDKYTQKYFGITAQQSASSGLAAYTPKGGINTVRFGVGATYLLTSQWSLGARATAASLRGDARDSVITEKSSQNTYGLFANYRF